MNTRRDTPGWEWLRADLTEQHFQQCILLFARAVAGRRACVEYDKRGGPPRIIDTRRPCDTCGRTCSCGRKKK
jgi:hypothetical protein